MIRVLLVDDFESFRRFVASSLGRRPEFQVICEAADGLDAVQQAGELQPDLILLDVGMPKLNGIEAARQIRRCSPKSKILFVSQDSSTDTVHVALETGAAGYVVKSDAGSELLPAIEAVLRGEMFVGKRFARHDFSPVMTSTDSKIAKNFYRSEDFALPTPQRANGTHCHEVHFYSKETSLQNSVAQFIGSALKAGNPAILVATERHRNDLLLRLQALGLDVRAAEREGRYISVEAADAVSTFTLDSQFDSARYQELFGNLIVNAAEAARKEPSEVAVFGECVQLMWALGKPETAIQMEKLTNHVVRKYGVDMFCAYPLTNFHGRPDTDMFDRICAEHSAVYCG
jgi:DNA-binding NarL/FixJ family response regulator